MIEVLLFYLPMVKSCFHSYIFFLPQQCNFNLTQGQYKITLVGRKIGVPDISISVSFVTFSENSYQTLIAEFCITTFKMLFLILDFRSLEKKSFEETIVFKEHSLFLSRLFLIRRIYPETRLRHNFRFLIQNIIIQAGILFPIGEVSRLAIRATLGISTTVVDSRQQSSPFNSVVITCF